LAGDNVRLSESASDPAAVENIGFIYTKAANGKTELFMRLDAGGSVVQLTKNALLYLNNAKLDNDTYLKARNAAGNGDVDLIKAGRNEADDADVAVLPDAARLATNAAPTEATQIANKKYVDDQIASAVPDDDAFGSWASKSQDTSYTAETDGFVCVNAYGGHAGGWVKGWSPADTLRVWNGSGYVDFGAGFTMPVRKGDTWKVTSSNMTSVTVYWLPIGG